MNLSSEVIFKDQLSFSFATDLEEPIINNNLKKVLTKSMKFPIFNLELLTSSA